MLSKSYCQFFQIATGKDYTNTKLLLKIRRGCLVEESLLPWRNKVAQGETCQHST